MGVPPISSSFFLWVARGYGLPALGLEAWEGGRGAAQRAGGRVRGGGALAAGAGLRATLKKVAWIPPIQPTN